MTLHGCRSGNGCLMYAAGSIEFFFFSARTRVSDCALGLRHKKRPTAIVEQALFCDHKMPAYCQMHLVKHVGVTQPPSDTSKHRTRGRVTGCGDIPNKRSVLPAGSFSDYRAKFCFSMRERRLQTLRAVARGRNF